MASRKPYTVHAQKVFGHPSWRIASSSVEAFVTVQGGHMGPVVFDRKGRKIQPYSVAPWTDDEPDPGWPPLLSVLRGDFFCLPFGGNGAPFHGEKHPVHGETANAKWRLDGVEKQGTVTTLRLSMKTKTRAGLVRKNISLVDGHNAVYCQHVISGMSGPMSLGHHPMLKFPDKAGSGIITHSPIKYGMVNPTPFEDPAARGYSILEPGCRFTDLRKVRTITGKFADASRYPARRGFEDLVMMVARPAGPFAWTAVTFPKQRFAWFSLKDPRVLKQTVLWISNGGRHGAPWNGRHVNVLGVEEVTGFFANGLADAAKPNVISKRGDATCLRLDRKKPLAVNFIMAAAPIPAGFDEVKTIKPGPDRRTVVLTSKSGKKANAAVCWDFVNAKVK
jgi:hypothetical protein